jgi:hypothetical protein
MGKFYGTATRTGAAIRAGSECRQPPPVPMTIGTGFRAQIKTHTSGGIYLSRQP